MDNFNTQKLSKITVFLVSMLFSVSTLSLTELTDEELGDVTGQASLLSIDKYDYDGGSGVNNFYQVKVNATIETSVNIDKLDLRDNFNNSQIDIDNLSLNGGDDSNGNATVSSATLTNPFVEFAFAGTIDSTNARTREIIGIRIGADDISGFMSFGVQDTSGGTLDTGINMFRGYMATQQISGTATTLDSSATVDTNPGDGIPPASWANANQTNLANVTGTRGDFTVSGVTNVFNSCSGFGCLNPLHAITAAGITNEPFTSTNIKMRFPSVTSNLFTIPGIVINTATPISSTQIEANGITIPTLNFEAAGDTSVALAGLIPIPISLFSTGAVTSGLTIDSTVTEDLRFIHRAEIVDGGFYLSAQNTAVQWRGAPTGDIAQAGWWMSIAEPVELGQLNLQNVFLDDNTLDQVTSRISDYLQANTVQIASQNAIDGLFGTTNAPLGNIALTGAAPVILELSNQNLGSQQLEIRNCWNGNVGC